MTPELPNKPLSAVDRIVAFQKEEERKKLSREEEKRTTERKLAPIINELKELVDKQYPELENIDRQLGLTSSLADLNTRCLQGKGVVMKERAKVSGLPRVSYNEQEAVWKGEVEVNTSWMISSRSTGSRKPSFCEWWSGHYGRLYQHGFFTETEWSDDKRRGIRELAEIYVGLHWGNKGGGGNSIHLIYGRDWIRVKGGKLEASDRNELDFSDPEFSDKFQNALEEAFFHSRWEYPSYHVGDWDRNS